MNKIRNKYLTANAKEVFWLLILGVPFLIWTYSILTELNKGVPKTKRFSKFFYLPLIVYPLIYLVTAPFIVLFGTKGTESILPFHYGAMACIFLLMLLTTSTIIRFEKSQNIKKSGGIGLFFGIWYFPIGIWSIQPKLNKYYKQIK